MRPTSTPDEPERPEDRGPAGDLPVADAVDLTGELPTDDAVVGRFSEWEVEE